MSDDDPSKKMMNTPEWLRQTATPDWLRSTTTPASDALRSQIDTRQAFTFDNIALRGLDVMGQPRLLDVVRDLHLPTIDTTGLTSLAAAALSHTKLLAGPLSEYSKLSEIISPTIKELEAASSTLKLFESQFRLPDYVESARLAHESIMGASSAVKLLGEQFESPLKNAMLAMNTPWVRPDLIAGSVHGFSEIQALGAAINFKLPFDNDLSTVLRGALGDWRGVTLPAPIFDDPVIRSDFYVSLGFDTSLTDFPAEAFDRSLWLAGLRPPRDAEVQTDNGEPGLERNGRAYQQLLTLERAIREFIDRVMTQAFGADWPTQRMPTGMLDAWKGKRKAALPRWRLVGAHALPPYGLGIEGIEHDHTLAGRDDPAV
jgi:hypothetical protein